ncbi:MAG: recombinase family protein [Candidatus Parcubacteria bacterium]|nr:recombinase family protein [Candidatus Paceibacterota bacterium]
MPLSESAKTYAIFEDKISGGTQSRPQLDKLMEQARQKKFRTIY